MGVLKSRSRRERNGIYPQGLRSKIHSARVVLGEKGPGFFLFRVLPWSLRRDYSIFGQSLDRIVPFPPPRFPFVLRPAAKEDIPAVMSLRKGYYTKETLLRRLDGGHMGFLGWSGEKLVYIHWIFTGSLDVPYIHGRIDLGPNDVYSDEILTHPEFRRSGVHAHSGFLVRRTVKEKGFRRLFSAVASWNDVPGRNMIRSGMTEVARLRREKAPVFGKWKWSGDVEVRDDGSITFQAPR